MNASKRARLSVRRDPARARRDDRGGARRALAAHGAAVRARPHQPLAAPRRGRPGVGMQAGWTIVDCGIDDDATRAAWEQIFATPARRDAGAARHRHPHAPRPHRPGALAVRALEARAVDQRDRLQRRAAGEQRRRPASAARCRPPSWPATAWRPTPTPSSRSRAAATTTRAWCRPCPRASGA